MGMINFIRNIMGRFQLFKLLYKWDSDYKKEFIITLLAFTLLTYSIIDIDYTILDFMAIGVEMWIIGLQLGSELSILPRQYRPSYAGVNYTTQTSLHIAYKELSFLMSYVYPNKIEQKLHFKNPLRELLTATESPLVSAHVDDELMLKKTISYHENQNNRNFILSRHQIRYICIRIANKLQHTTNGESIGLPITADQLIGEKPIPIQKTTYFNALLTNEAFRSRIFRSNIKQKPELYTDLTSYFPVKKTFIDGIESIRFRDDFHTRVSGHGGITSLLLTENNKVAMLYQGSRKAICADSIALGGSGSMSYSDLAAAGNPDNFKDVIIHGMARETCEETGMEDYFNDIKENTIITGFFRWINRCGKPEFVGITKAGNVPFTQHRSIDGDEIIKFEEIPIKINEMKDFIKVFDYIKKEKMNLALSSLMALHRLTVIAGYNGTGATKKQKQIYTSLNDFIK